MPKEAAVFLLCAGGTRSGDNRSVRQQSAVLSDRGEQCGKGKHSPIKKQDRKRAHVGCCAGIDRGRARGTRCKDGSAPGTQLRTETTLPRAPAPKPKRARKRSRQAAPGALQSSAALSARRSLAHRLQRLVLGLCMMKHLAQAALVEAQSAHWTMLEILRRGWSWCLPLRPVHRCWLPLSFGPARRSGTNWPTYKTIKRGKITSRGDRRVGC